MNYFLRTFQKKFKRIPTFEDIYQKSLELLPDVKHFKSEYSIMLEVYIECRNSDVGIYGLADRLQKRMFPDVEIKFCLVPDLDVGYIDIQDDHYVIETPFSWFTVLHEFIHIMLTEVEFYDDEQMGYVIPSGVYYFYKYYGDTTNDSFSHTTTATFSVEVVDSIPPTWMIPPMDQILNYGAVLDYHVAAIDFSVIDHWTFNDTIQFGLTAEYYAGGSTAHITNITPLMPGTYGINLTVYDSNDNYCSATFRITVNEGVTTTTTTTTTTTDGTPVDDDNTPILVAGIGVSGAVAVVIVLVILKRRGPT